MTSPVPPEPAGFVDLQVNGYAGVDFNQDNLTPDELHFACSALRRDGVARVLATIITESLSAMIHRLRLLTRLMERDAAAADVIAGFHVEGPFISPHDGFRGAHPADAVRPADPDEARKLMEAAPERIRLVTLAPECDPGLRTTKTLVEAGISVAAGHCDPTLDQLDAAIDAGVSLFTHVGNGCPMLIQRHDNVIQRALSRASRLTLCFIADGAHIPFFALGNYLRCAGAENCLIVTDATAAAGRGPGRYRLGRWDVEVGDDLVARAPDGSHLIGSAVTMVQVAQNLERELGLTRSQIRRLLVGNPRRVLGLPLP